MRAAAGKSRPAACSQPRIPQPSPLHTAPTAGTGNAASTALHAHCAPSTRSLSAPPRARPNPQEPHSSLRRRGSPPLRPSRQGHRQLGHPQPCHGTGKVWTGNSHQQDGPRREERAGKQGERCHRGVTQRAGRRNLVARHAFEQL